MGRLTLAEILGKPQFPGCHKMSFADVISLPPLSLSKNISESDQLTAERMHRGCIEKMPSESIAPNLVWPTSVFCPPATANGWANVRFKIDIGRFPATCSRPLPLQPLSTASLMCWGCLGIILTLPTFSSYSDTSLHVVNLVTLFSTFIHYQTSCLKILQLANLKVIFLLSELPSISSKFPISLCLVSGWLYIIIAIILLILSQCYHNGEILGYCPWKYFEVWTTWYIIIDNLV